MDSLKRIGAVCMLCLLSIGSFAQQMNLKDEDATDFMRSNGKIYVVMAVVITIVLGIFIYLLNLDAKIKKLEKGNKEPG